MPAGASTVSVETFKEWGRDVRVRRIQPKLEALASQAKENGRSLEEEMRAKKIRDYKQLTKACPQFDLTCWPGELAELGSGFVHYFHFLWFLVAALVLVLLLQIPIMHSYGQKNWLVGWHWHLWGDSWSEKDSCSCIGGSGLSTGPVNSSGLSTGPMSSSQEVADYGTSCQMWDNDFCQARSFQYIVNNEPLTWQAAEDACVRSGGGGHLASVMNQAENDKIAALCASSNCQACTGGRANNNSYMCWLGGMKPSNDLSSGVFRWTDGTRRSFTNYDSLGEVYDVPSQPALAISNPSNTHESSEPGKWQFEITGNSYPSICAKPEGQFFSRPGRWCCTRWCFAKSSCATPPNTQSPWYSDVNYQGMLRYASGCEQDPQLLSTCAFDDSAPFHEAGVEAVTDEMYVESSWLTPGNYGPDQADDSMVPVMYLVMVIILSVLVLGMQQLQIVVDSKVDAGLTSPNDFAALVKGLPTTATDERLITRFFEDNALRGRKADIVKVVIGWDAASFREKISEIRRLQSALKLLAPSDPQIAEIKKEIAEITAKLASTAPDTAARLNSSGTVVVIFRYQEDLRAYLERWQSFWARWAYCDADDHSWMPFLLGTKQGSQLPRFPVGDMPVCRLKVARAPNPGDINWEQFTAYDGKNRRVMMQTGGIMTGLVLLSFLVTYGLNKLQDYLKTSGSGYSGRAISLLPGIGLALTNMGLMTAAKKFGSWEYHDTHTEQEFSIALKMTFALMINTGAVTLFANARPREWYMSGGLVDDLFYILLIDALLPPLMFFFDVKYYIMGWKRSKLRDATLQSWNELIKETKGVGKTPEQVHDLKVLKKQIDGFKKFFEPSEMYNPRRYANVMNTFLCTLFFAPVFPLAILIGIAGVLFQYAIDKYLLLRWYKRPTRPYNARLAMWSIAFLKRAAPISFSISFYVFLSPSWKEKSQVGIAFTFALIISICVALVPGEVLRIFFCMRLFLRKKGFAVQEDGVDYYKAQYLWSKEMKYHKDNFLYKCLPEAKNPEFLSPDIDSALRIDDVKSTYCAATARAADCAGVDALQVALRGGVVLSTSVPFAEQSSETADVAAEAAPRIYGAGQLRWPAAEGTKDFTLAAESPPRVYGASQSPADPPEISSPSTVGGSQPSEVALPVESAQPVAAAPLAGSPQLMSRTGSRRSLSKGSTRMPAAGSRRSITGSQKVQKHKSPKKKAGSRKAPTTPSTADCVESDDDSGTSTIPSAKGGVPPSLTSDADHATAPLRSSLSHATALPSPPPIAVVPEPAPSTAPESQAVPFMESEAEAHEVASPSSVSEGTSASTPTGVVWEFARDGRFSRYAADCQSFIESQYQKYRNGDGESQVRVKTGGRTVSVNFEKMTSKVVDPPSKNICELRRTER